MGMVQSANSLAIETRFAQDRLIASTLAVDLREEILSKPRQDPDQPAIFGREPGEYRNIRLYLDDRDDYDGLEDNPVTDIKGNPVPGMERFSRRVQIRHVLEDDTSKNDEKGTSRLWQYTVTVSKDGKEMSRLEWLDSRP